MSGRILVIDREDRLFEWELRKDGHGQDIVSVNGVEDLAGLRRTIKDEEVCAIIIGREIELHFLADVLNYYHPHVEPIVAGANGRYCRHAGRIGVKHFVTSIPRLQRMVRRMKEKHANICQPLFF